METIVKINNKDVVISCILDDITTLNVDVIVNAAHESLMGGGGVDGAIHRAAGPFLLRECREIPSDSNGVRCKTGEAYITAAYNLPSKHVIHTVAPKFVGGIIRRKVGNEFQPIYKNVLPDTDKDMENCYKRCIELADKNGLKSIAFPSLGTGGHAYPIELACPIAIKTTIQSLNNTVSLNRIIFVCFSQQDYDFYERNIIEITGEYNGKN